MPNREKTERISYSVNEAIEATSLGRTSIYELIKSGALKAIRVRGRTVIPAHSLRQLVGGDTTLNTSE